MPNPLTVRRSVLGVCLAFCGLGSAIQAQAKNAPLQILPWNGHKAALSLTYDDADPIHLDLAVPEMDKRGIKGTFYIIAKEPSREAEWPAVAAKGHELGNHSWSHRHTNELSAEEEKTEVTDARAKLETLAKKPVLSFAYPFVEISPGLKKWVEANAIVARGGGQADNYLTPDMDPDWMNLPSQATMTAYAYETYKDWVDVALARGAWAPIMIHAIEGSNWFQPVAKATYVQFLDYLVEKEADLWTAPFLEVGAYWRAQKMVEASEPKKRGKWTTIKWKKPALFPKGVILKARVEGKGLVVAQGGKAVKALEPGVYPIAFDAGEVTLTNATWKEVVVAPVATVPAAKAPVFISSDAAPVGDVLKLDDFESTAPAYGASWWAGCDSNGATKLLSQPFAPIAGGSSKSPGHSAAMKGALGPMQDPWPWAVLTLGLKADSSPVDLTAYKALRFYTKGDGKSHAVALDKASGTDYCGFSVEFVSPKEWTLVTLPFDTFAQATWGKQLEKKFHDVVKITFSPGSGGAEFDFLIDDVELVK